MSTNRSLHVFPLLSLTALVLIAPACDSEVDVDSEFERSQPVDMGGCDYEGGCENDDGSEPPRPTTPRPKKPNPGKPPEKTPRAVDVDELMHPID
jgi:hypothetical protein